MTLVEARQGRARSRRGYAGREDEGDDASDCKGIRSFMTQSGVRVTGSITTWSASGTCASGSHRIISARTVAMPRRPSSPSCCAAPRDKSSMIACLDGPRSVTVTWTLLSV